VAAEGLLKATHNFGCGLEHGFELGLVNLLDVGEQVIRVALRSKPNDIGGSFGSKAAL
jgi:hypothetical protein